MFVYFENDIKRSAQRAHFPRDDIRAFKNGACCQRWIGESVKGGNGHQFQQTAVTAMSLLVVKRSWATYVAKL